MNKQQLAAKIWDSANKMRSKIEANEYKDYILGFIFYKFLSEKEEKFLVENGSTQEDIQALSEKDTETVSYIQENIGYFISYQNLFSTWLSMGKDFDVSNVVDALSAFSRLTSDNYKHVYNKIFDTLQTGLTKLGDSSGSQTKAISNLIQLIKDIPMDGKQDYDVLGFIYEYLISNFAANAGKKAGEFYTPHEVSLLMSEIIADHLKDRPEIQIYDPTSGSGSLLINIGRAVAKHIDDANKIKYYAQELKENTYNLTRMNLVMRGILPSNIVTRNGDTLEDDWPMFEEGKPETYNPLYVDAVVSNPPYSQNWDPMNKEGDPRYANYGLAPKSKADYAFLLHDLYHLRPDGIMTIVLPHGVLFRGGEEGEIRKNLIERNNIDAIIGLPANIFFGTGIPTIVMVLRQKRDREDILIVDASKGYEKVGKNNKLRASDIRKVVDTVTKRISVEKYSKVVSRDEIRSNDYNLNIPRYVDSSEKSESYDIYASMFGGIPVSEINELEEYWKAFPGLINTLFTGDDHYKTLSTDDVKKAIENSDDVKKYKQLSDKAWNGLEQYLQAELIDHKDSLPIVKEESVIYDELLKRLSGLQLIDKYDVYQTLDDSWTKTAIDLEIIQTEGSESIRQVDANMVIKKKDNKEIEVQDGWVGHVIPFELVQKTILSSDYADVKAKEERINEIGSESDEIRDSLGEDEKELVSEDGESWIAADITKYVKKLDKKAKYDEESYESKIIKVSDLLSEEKTLKSQIKKEYVDLENKTKSTIENLSDEQVIELLTMKWITPLINEISSRPNEVIKSLEGTIAALRDKYATTYADVSKEIEECEAELSKMIDDLTGDSYDMKGLKEFQTLLNAKK